MFAGIGGFRSGLTRAGGFQCVGHCEIDKYANASYTAIYEPGKEERYYPDATKIDPADLPDFELLCGGFPCQAFSNAGRRRGFADARGTLFFEIARLAQAKRPAYLLLENVPGLLSHDKGKTFSVILSALDDLGYHVEWSVLNSKHFGVPQSRRRLFIIGYLDPRCAGKILPVFGTGGKALVQVLGGPQGSRVYDPDGVACTQTAGAGGMGGKTGLYLIPPQKPFVDILFKALQVNERRASRWCQKVREPMLKEARKLSSDETKNLTALESIWYEGNISDREHYNWTRYYALNLHSVFYRGTVEWRCFNSTLHAGKIAAYVNLCLAMSAQAINQRSTVMRKTMSDNELFTFRVWLVRLGLNGEEFKNTRNHLLANLDGDRAWRYDKDSYEVNKKKKKSREMER